jgi:type 1 fimbria pilin
MRRLAVAGCLVHACSALGAEGGSMALDCTFSNTEASPWRMVTPLTSATPVGSTLYQRTVSLFVSFKYGGSAAKHELVSAGHWREGTVVTDGMARTNVPGIGFQWVGVSGEGVEYVLKQSVNPMAVAAQEIIDPGGSPSANDNRIARFRQYLVLDAPVSELPPGKLIVKSLQGSPSVALYAIDMPKGDASLGKDVTVPTLTMPPNLCKQARTYVGVGNVCIGTECEISVPNRCEIESNMIVPVTLGNFSIDRFRGIHSTSAPVDFKIALNQCAASAKPSISFRDKAAQPNADNTLLQLSAPEGKAVARGFNIVMTNGLTGKRIAYGEPGTAVEYPMRRVGDMAELPLSAQYIRTGTDDELRPGKADGGAEFSFTFP